MAAAAPGEDAPAQVLPDYSGGGLLNLVQSVALASGAKRCAYPAFRGLDVDTLAAARNLVLILVDGLGAQALNDAGRDTILRRHLHATATSVFPSTTAAAITTVMTGLAPAQHGATGWHIYFEEIDRVLASLPLTPRGGAPIAPRLQPIAPRLFDHRPLYASLDRRSAVLSPVRISDSPFNRHHGEGADRLAYGTIEECFARIEALLREGRERRLLYAYYPDLDEAAHEHGIDGAEVRRVLARFDAAFARLADTVGGTDTAVIVTADHGFIDSPPEHVIELDAHPRLAGMLYRPLCGERRVAYCYVREECRADFERYVTGELGHACTPVRSAELIREGWFGPGAPHARLASRTGDYTLLMKGDWTVVDWLPGERRHRMVGVHGGTSASEMRVPVIVLRG